MTDEILSSMSLHFFGASMADDEDSMGATDDKTFGRFVGTDADVSTSHNTLPFLRLVPSFLPYVVTCCLFSKTLTLFSLDTSNGIDEHNEGFFMRFVFVVKTC